MDNLLNLLVFASASSLITIAFGFFSENRNKTEKIIIFTVCFLWGVDSLFLLSEETGFYKDFPHLLYLNQPFELFLGPLVYYRFRIMVEGKIRFNRLTIFLFLPGVLAVLYFITFFIQSPEVKLASVGFHNLEDGFVRSIYLFIMYSPVPWFILCLILAVIHGWRMLSKKGIEMILHKKFLVGYNLLWILLFFIIYIAIVFKNSLMLRGMLLLINCVLIFSYYLEKKYADFFLAMQKDSSETRYKRSMLNGIDTHAVIERIKELMNLENIYLNENLSLQTLSSILNITPHQLSEILNSGLNTNFKSFVNRYRINAVKKMLLDNKHESIIRIAYQCGFNSKNAFNTAFQKSEGMSPTEFIDKNAPR